MTKLSDTQLVVLSAAGQREDGAVYLPGRLRGGAAEKVLASLCQKGLIEDIGIAESAGMTSSNEEGKTPYRISQAGLSAVGVDEGGYAGEGHPEGEGAPSDPVRMQLSPAADPSGGGQAEASQQKMPARQGSKLAAVIVLLSREGGASIDELIKATNWLPHTIRAALTGLRKRGSAIQRSKREDGTTIYRIDGGKAAQAISGEEPNPVHQPADEVAR